MDNGVLVIGSANMDLVASVKAFPKPGETIFGNDFAMHPGGKGANQAVCCARLGGEIQFIGKMGNDVYRDKLVESMSSAGVGLEPLMIEPEAATGIAMILVDSAGENEIVVISGSNMKLTPDDIESKRDVFKTVSLVLLQLEIPVETVSHAVAIGREAGITTVLNPAPARELPDDVLSRLDFLTPNETEVEILTGVPVTDIASAETAARSLLNRGVKNVIITLGERGCFWMHASGSRAFRAIRVHATDTTAAGDAFNGALALALARDEAPQQAIEFAVKVAAYSVTKAGAQSSMPTMQDIESYF